MKKINIIYCILPLILGGLYYINHQYGQSSPTFFGFAENKETQINMDFAVLVGHIAVAPGQFVKKGDLLVEVAHQALEQKGNDVAFNISELQAKGELHRSDLKASLGRLRAQKAERTGEIGAQINALQSQVELNRSLVKGLKSIKIDDAKTTPNNLVLEKTARLREALRLSITPLDIEISRIESELRNTDPMQVEVSRLKNEQAMIGKEQDKLSIYAPADGLIGTIHCKAGENLPAFAPIISFYEQNPNQVVAFVHESLVLKINVGDSLLVVSSLRPEEKVMGHIAGLGHRIIEIPERLRRLPEVRTYGREVLVNLPAKNRFLQNEKVVLNVIQPIKKTLAGLFAAQ